MRASCRRTSRGWRSGQAAEPTPWCDWWLDALRFYFEFHDRHDGFHGAFIHDALVIAASLDPGLARTEAVRVEVELAGRWTTGETVTDWRHAWGLPPNVDVAVEIDAEAFVERFIERVGDLAARRG